MKIKVLPSGVEIENDPNKSLMQLCHDNGVHINSLCKGQPKCAECRVKIVQGDHNVIPPTAVEVNLLGNNYYLDGRRLSCQVRAFGDITIDVSEQVERELNAHKKVRGFRSKDKSHQSHAVLDTLILKSESATEIKGQGRGAAETKDQGRGAADSKDQGRPAEKRPEKHPEKRPEKRPDKRR